MLSPNEYFVDYEVIRRPLDREDEPDSKVTVITQLDGKILATRAPYELVLTKTEGTPAATATGELLLRCGTKKIRFEPLLSPEGRIVGVLDVGKYALSAAQTYYVPEVDKLKRDLEQRDDYLAMVAHDLRSPLSVILVCCDYIRTTMASQTADFNDFMERIMRNNQRAITLVEDLLDLARLEGGTPLNLEDAQVSEVIRMAVDSVGPLLARKRLRIETNLEPISSAVDQKRLTQVVDNIIINAIKFSPQGGTIRVNATRSSSPGQFIISIEDQGPGIPADKVSVIFQKYKQLNAKDVRDLGVGLGLCIAQKYVHLHGGYIEVDGNVTGKGGAKFSIVLPIHMPSQDRVAILVVDDDAEIAEYMAQSLKSDDVDVCKATSGEEALQMLNSRRLDVMVSDIKMPGMDGIELLQRAKAKYSNLMVMLVSGYYQNITQDLAKSVFRADRILAKPIEEEELRGAVQQMLKKRSSNSRPSTPRDP